MTVGPTQTVCVNQGFHRMSHREPSSQNSGLHSHHTVRCTNAGGVGLGPLGQKPVLVGFSYAPSRLPDMCYTLMTAHEDVPFGHSDTVT